MYNQLLVEVINEAKKINIPISTQICLDITINTRAKGRFGRCKKRNGVYFIELSQHLLSAETKYIKQTLAHEALHTCPECLNHGIKWKYYASKMNREYGYEITRLSSCDSMNISNPRKERAKYIITCIICGHKYYKQRESKMIKNIQSYRCKCGGALDVRKMY